MDQQSDGFRSAAGARENDGLRPFRGCRALEGAVSQREYLVGDSFTAADVYVGSGIGFGMQFGTIDKRSAFVQYWGRISARPAALRAKEIDDALAAEKAQPSAPPEPT